MRKLVLLGAVVLVAGIGIYAFQKGAPKDPGTLASREASKGASIVEVNLPTQLSEQATIGKRGFDSVCADCHGENAAGREGTGPPLVHKIYEPSHHGDMAFLLAVKNGVRAHHWKFGNMPPQPGLTDADVQAIVAYVRELQRENGID